MRQDNINCQMCHMRMSLKAQTHFHTPFNVQVITPHGDTQQFDMLILVYEKTSTPPPGHLTPLPCILSRLNSNTALTTPYAFTPLPLPSLCSRGALLTCLRRCLPSLCASAAAYHPYACVVPSQHASNTTNHPYACVVPSRHASNTANHLYACVVPSRHASDSTYHP
ncbi:hypothetical protein O181_038114 [Austropuccinia psidii MF-1]|uniref:Uncharacterized protein n=1 Tax=Austropuccinia psidii MF-1 TaxID=1389203 RepID=A0A9Q3HD91_9BASI|nr:hypothetical protein [Austropuccinia psidii MF-1]